MKLAELIWHNARGEHRLALACVGVGALTGVGALIIITTIARTPTQVTLVNLALFVSMVVASLLSTHRAGHVLVNAVELGLDRLRLRISMAVAGAEREQLDRIGRTPILDRVNQSLNSISFAGGSLASALQSLCVSALAFVYVMWLAGPAILIIGPHLAVALYFCLKYARSVLELRRRRQALQGQLLDRLTDMFDGAKEIRLHRARAEAIERHYIETSDELRDVSAQVGFAWFDNSLLLTTNIYALLAILVVVLPGYFDLEPDVRGPLLVAMLFVWANLRVVLMRHGLYAEAEATLVEVEQLALELESGPQGSTTLAPTTAPKSDLLGAGTGIGIGIELEGVEYVYPASEGAGFRLGPLDLRIEPGELLFIVGGNGAGKSTLVGVLTGLLRPTWGRLRVNGLTIDHELDVDAYRELCSVIFTDVHLFQRAYGLLDADPELVRARLRELEIDDVTGFEAGRFTKLTLSTGQRKRLAMVVALLEDRPLVVLDEWAADQDPAFRRHFYQHLLPRLRRQGKTVIVISHDDRYFDCADRVVVLDYGRIREGPPSAES